MQYITWTPTPSKCSSKCTVECINNNLSKCSRDNKCSTLRNNNNLSFNNSHRDSNKINRITSWIFKKRLLLLLGKLQCRMVTEWILWANPCNWTTSNKRRRNPRKMLLMISMIWWVFLIFDDLMWFSLYILIWLKTQILYEKI